MNNSFIQCKKSNEEYTENLQWRKNLIIVFEKLGDKEQSSQSFQYLINQLQEMNLNQLQFYIDCILENSESFNSFGKKEVIKLLGLAIQFHKNKLCNYLNKIISFLIKRLNELPQSGILEITLDTLGITCSNIIIEQKHLQKIGLNLSTISNSSGISNNSSASTSASINNGLIDIYFNPIFQLFNQPTRHTQIAGILACQKVIENIYDVINLLRPQVNKVLNQLLKKLTISTVTIQSSSSMSSFPAQYCIPHTLSTISSLFRVLGQNYFLYHCILPSSTIDQIQNNVISNCIRTLFSNDWTARLSACSLLLTIIEVLPKYYYSKRLNEILKSLNDCKYDKIKSIRDCVNKSIQLYNQINLNQNDQIIPTTPSHIEAKFKLQEQHQQQNSNVYNSPNKIKSPSTPSSTINSPSTQSPSLYSSSIRRPQLNNHNHNNNMTTTTTTTTTPSFLSSPSYPLSPSLKSITPPYNGLSSPTLKSKNYTSSLSASSSSSSSSTTILQSQSQSSYLSSKTLHPSSPGFKSIPVGSYASPPLNSSPINNISSTSSSLSTSPLIYSTTNSNNNNNNIDKKDIKSNTTLFRDIFHQQQQQVQQKQHQLEYQQKQRQLHIKQQTLHQTQPQYNSIFNDNFSIINNDQETNQDNQEDYNINDEEDDEDEYNIHIKNLKNHNQYNISSFDNFNHPNDFNNLSITDNNNKNNNNNSTNNNNNNSSSNTNILTLSSLKSSPVSTPNKSSQNNITNNNHNTTTTTTITNNSNNINNNLSSPSTSSSPKLNIKPKETITTTTTITTEEEENETVKLLHEMMQTMNDFMIETRESIGQIKSRLTVVESSVLTLQKYYLSK